MGLFVGGRFIDFVFFVFDKLFRFWKLKKHFIRWFAMQSTFILIQLNVTLANIQKWLQRKKMESQC